MSEKVKIELNDERHSLPNDNSRFIKLDVMLSDTMWPLKKPILVPRRQRNKKSYLKSLSLLSSKRTRTTRTLTSAYRCSVKRKRYITSDNLRMENNTIDTAKLEKSFKKISQISCLGKRVHKLINTSTAIKNKFLPVGKKLYKYSNVLKDLPPSNIMTIPSIKKRNLTKRMYYTNSNGLLKKSKNDISNIIIKKEQACSSSIAILKSLTNESSIITDVNSTSAITTSLDITDSATTSVDSTVTTTTSIDSTAFNTCVNSTAFTTISVDSTDVTTTIVDSTDSITTSVDSTVTTTTSGDSTAVTTTIVASSDTSISSINNTDITITTTKLINKKLRKTKKYQSKNRNRMEKIKNKRVFYIHDMDSVFPNLNNKPEYIDRRDRPLANHESDDELDSLVAMPKEAMFVSRYERLLREEQLGD